MTIKRSPYWDMIKKSNEQIKKSANIKPEDFTAENQEGE